ncbi:protein of unknown function [Pseudomonas sp. JV551A1]|nr:protein of unknown function [Pseudomonas sp. JV551A1]
MITYLQTFDICAYRFNDANAFMTWNHRVARAEDPVPEQEIRVADTGCNGANKDLVPFRFGQREFS